MKNSKNKKGEISSEVLIGTILLIVAAIAVFVIYDAATSSFDSQKEACHTSVILRSAPLVERILPLQCTEEKICVRESNLLGIGSGGNCKTFNGDNVEKLKVSNSDNEEYEIKKALADEMYNCWTMMGEGKVNFMHKLSGGKIVNSLVKGKKFCFVCSRIEFDNNIKEKFAVSEQAVKEVAGSESLKNKIKAKVVFELQDGCPSTNLFYRFVDDVPAGDGMGHWEWGTFDEEIAGNSYFFSVVNPSANGKSAVAIQELKLNEKNKEFLGLLLTKTTYKDGLSLLAKRVSENNEGRFYDGCVGNTKFVVHFPDELPSKYKEKHYVYNDEVLNPEKINELISDIDRFSISDLSYYPWIGGIKGFDEFLKKEKISGKDITYFEAFSDSRISSFNSINDLLIEKSGGEPLDWKELPSGSVGDVINPDNQLMIVYTVSKDATIFDTNFNLGVMAVLSGILVGKVPFVGVVSSAMVKSGIVYSSWHVLTSKGEDAKYELYMMPYTPDSLNSLGCTTFETYES